MRTVLILLLLSGLPQLGWAQQAGAIERIAQLLERQTQCFKPGGSGVERQSLRILDSSQLSIPAASFRLAGLQRTARDEYLATVRCSSSTECLPFLVVFRCGRPASAMVERPKVARGLKRGSAVHPGDRARLEMTITGANLSFPVICLEGGDVGEVIRIRAIATNRVFAAVVTGPRQLRGVEGSQ
jgi:hypothetical protein